MIRPRPLALAVALLPLLIACGAPRQSVRIEPVPSSETPVMALPAAPTSPPPLALAPPNRGSERVPAVLPVPASRPSPALPAGGTPVSTIAGGDPALLAAVRDALGADAERFSVVVRRLHDGRAVAWNADREYYAASLFKLALLYEAERQRSVGLLDFSREVAVLDEDVAEDLGTLDSLEIGADGAIPVRAAVSAMVTRSDNTAAVLMLRLLGSGTVDRTLAALGLQHTSVTTRDLPTTAADMALLMEMIVRGVGIDPAWREDMLGLLLRQETRWGIPRLLPVGVRTGNKTGTWSTATHDVAFVDAPGGIYVIAVLCDRGWDWDPIARVSRAVYDVLGGGQSTVDNGQSGP